MPPTASTTLVVQLLRRLFVCPAGHGYMLRVSGGVLWLECGRCLSVRILPDVARPGVPWFGPVRRG